MGNQNKKILKRQLSEYEKNQLVKFVSHGENFVEISSNKFNIGEFFNQDIDNEDFFYFEE